MPSTSHDAPGRPSPSSPDAADSPDTTGAHEGPLLRCRGLARRFGSVAAVDGVDLDVARGSLTALLGPSGCGKSTVLRLIAGLIVPDSGTIAIAGRTVADRGVDVAPERRGVGMVFQDNALFPHLDVRANVAFGLVDLPPDRRDERIAEVLALVGLSDLEARRPDQLSGGQAQRVALARALAPEPRLLLLDEPFSSLDASLRVSVREEVRAILRAADQTALFVTHDQDEALSLADRVAVMRAGRIEQVASPRALYREPATRFVAEFVGDGDTLPARRAGRFLVDTPIGRVATRAAIEVDDNVIVLRPEQVRLRADADGALAIESVSYNGHDVVVRLVTADGHVVHARRGAETTAEAGQTVVVEVDGPVLAFPA